MGMEDAPVEKTPLKIAPVSETLGEPEPWEGDATKEAYEQYQEPLEVVEYKERKQEYSETINKWDSYIGTALTEDASALSPEELESSLTTREKLQQEFVEASADYPGDWTALLYERLSNPTYKERFIQQRQAAMDFMLPGEPSEFERKPKDYQPHYQAQIESYDENLNEIFSRTDVGPAANHFKAPRNVGMNTLGNPGVVFDDATFNDVPLTPRQKNIVEAHEKGHGIRDYTSPYDKAEIRTTLDEAALIKLTEAHRAAEAAGTKTGRFRSIYVEKPEEVIERMAQFKNYFGMTAEETFTKKHLDYIREHYITDTGFDNGISDLLHCVTPKTEMAFLKIINKYPI